MWGLQSPVLRHFTRVNVANRVLRELAAASIAGAFMRSQDTGTPPLVPDRPATVPATGAIDFFGERQESDVVSTLSLREYITPV